MIPSNRSVRTRSFRRRMGLAGLSLGLLLGHVTAAFATWYDTDVVSPVFCSQQPTHRAYGYVRSDGVSAIAFADGAGAPVGMLEGSIGNWAYTNMTQYGAPATYSDPVGYERSDGIPTVVYPGAVTWGHVYELARVAGTWVVSDLHMAAGILTYGGVYPGTQVWGYVRGDKVSTVVYASESNRHIHELALVNGHWQDADLSVVTGTTGLGTNAMHAFVPSSGTAMVVYVGTDGYVWGLWLFGGRWHAEPIGFKAGQAMIGDSVMGYVRADGVYAVVYRGVDWHIYEIALLPGPVKGVAWKITDLTLAAHAPVAASPPWAYVRPGSAGGTLVSTVVYADSTSSQHVHAMTLDNGTWSDGDLSLAAGSSSSGNSVTAFLDAQHKSILPHCSAFREMRLMHN